MNFKRKNGEIEREARQNSSKLYYGGCKKIRTRFLKARISKRVEILLCKISTGSDNGAELTQ